MQQAQKEREERRLTTMLYIGSVVVMLILLYATYLNFRKYANTVQAVRVHNNAMLELEGLLSSLRDAETGVRGYQLTNDTSFLEPYRLANRRLYDHSGRMSLYGLNASDSLDLVELKRLAAHLDRMWRSMIFKNPKHELVPPTMTNELREAKVVMDSLRVVHDHMMVDRDRRREALLKAERIEGVDTPFMLVIYSLLAIVATALLFWRLTRTLRRNEEVRITLRAKVRDLDREVAHRSSLQNLLQQVLDVSPSGIMSYRSVRDAEGRIIDFEWLSSNRMANAILGRSDLVGKRLLEEMPENKTAGLFDDHVRSVEQDIPTVRELLHAGPSLHGWFRYHGVKLEDGFMVTLSDITEQKRAEQVNQESDRMELIAQITRTVAHEVRNPLTNIHLALEQIQDEMGDRLEAAQPYFSIADRNLKRIGTLIREMLESSRKRELTLLPCKMQDIVNNVLKAVGDRLALRNMKGTVSIEDELPQVMADCELIDLALINIAVNAVEAMEPGKGHLSLRATRDQGAVVLEIADNGKGIPPENMQRLFEPFYSGRPGGLGLGLTTARSILYSHGVQLDVRSTVGEGTVFILRFPEQALVPGT